MKKRSVAVMLSLVMCTATVSEAGAASFVSSDLSVESEEQQTEVSQDLPEETQMETSQDVSETDLFSAGEGADAGLDEMDAELTEDIFSSGAEDDAFQTTAAASDMMMEDPSGAVCVTAEDWVQTEEGFKLRREDDAQQLQTTDVQTDAVEFFAEDALDAGMLEEDATAATASVTEQEAEVPAEEFYTAEDGILKVCTEYENEYHTGYYLFDENGLMVTGESELKDAAAVISEDAEAVQTDLFYFTQADEAVLYAGCEGEAVTPYTSTVGQQQKNIWIWNSLDGVFRYYDANGIYVSVEELNKQAQSAGTYTGYFAINGEYYCLNASGKPKTGNVTLTVNGSSDLYYFEPDSEIPGRMFHEGWRCVQGSKGERWLYYEQGVTNPGNIGKYYEHGVMAKKLGAPRNDRKYLIDKYGYLLKSVVKKAEDGAYYGTDKNGAIYTNTLVKYKNYRYYFGSDGKRAAWKNKWMKVGNHYYYFGNVAGRVSEKYGWQKIYSSKGQFRGWFYFDSNGNHYTNKTTSTGYYFTPTGKLASGLVERNGKKYIYEVSTESVRKGTLYKSTMVRYKNKWYLASSSGSLYESGWRKYNGNYYYLKNYVIQTNQFMKKDGVNGYLDANGKYTTGWVLVSNSKNLVRYIDPDGDDFVRNTSKWINGVLYYFDANGYRISDVSSRYPNGPYYLEVQRLNGIMTVYTDRTKTIPIKTIRVSVGLPSTPTPTGEYTLQRSLRWQPLMGPSWGQYGTHVQGAGQGGIFIHSVACGQANSYNLPAGEYNKLGQPASHGCIRVCVADAKWVYENCSGSRINIIDGVIQYNDALKGPLGKKPLTPLRGSANFDPTDPAI